MKPFIYNGNVCYRIHLKRCCGFGSHVRFFLVAECDKHFQQYKLDHPEYSGLSSWVPIFCD